MRTTVDLTFRKGEGTAVFPAGTRVTPASCPDHFELLDPKYADLPDGQTLVRLPGYGLLVLNSDQVAAD